VSVALKLDGPSAQPRILQPRSASSSMNMATYSSNDRPQGTTFSRVNDMRFSCRCNVVGADLTVFIGQGWCSCWTLSSFKQIRVPELLTNNLLDHNFLSPEVIHTQLAAKDGDPKMVADSLSLIFRSHHHCHTHSCYIS